MMATLTLMPSCSAVASSHEVIWKPPSPTTTHTSFSGQANLAPMAAGRAKPMVPRPPEVMSERGLSWWKYCASHIWCWPTSVTTMVSRFWVRRQMSLITCAA